MVTQAVDDWLLIRLKSSNGEKITFKEYPKSPTDHKTIVTAITNTQLCHRMNQDQVIEPECAFG